MLHPFHGKRDPYPRQMESLASSETLVLVSHITWRHVRAEFYLPFFCFCFKARSQCRENRLFASSRPSVCSRVSTRLSLDGYL
jgi:hypothetical protein